MGILKDLEEQIQSVNPYFEYRPSQDEGSEMVYSMVQSDDGGVVLLEGPCGFGKTYAYLMPLLKDMKPGSAKKLVIATDGIALQEQLYQKDIPAALEILEKQDLVSAMLKGRNNYLCKMAYAEAIFTHGEDLSIIATNPDDRKQTKAMQEWAEETKTGDTSELPFIPNHSVAEKFILIDGDDCLGSKCSSYGGCFYYKNRKKAVREADIVVTNYHYLFTAVETGHRGDMLPAGEISYVFDEAHTIVDIFRDYTEVKFTDRTLNKIISGVNSFSKESPLFKQIFKYNSDLPDEISEAARTLKLALVQLKLDLFHDYNTSYLVEEIIADRKQRTSLESFLDLLENTFGALTRISDSALTNMADMDRAELEDKDKKKISKTSAALEKIIDTVKLGHNIRRLMKVEMPDDICVWVEHDKEGETSEIHIKNIAVGDKIKNHFFVGEENITYNDEFYPYIPPRVILTSATLSTGENFNFIKNQLGVDDTVKTYEFVGESPFDLTKQQLWYLPPGAVDGTKKEFQEYFVREIDDILNATHGGALCLFTSYANLRKAYERLNRRMRLPFTLLRQGDAPKAHLTRLFANDADSVLFGTKSFFTGVDVPGPSLRCVIIDKLPFAMQGDPIIRKITKRPRSFYSFSIPNMIITLKQAIGRGVRSKDDKCVIVILDNRMASAGYKGTINESFFYKKTGTRDLGVVQEYVENYMAVAQPYVQRELPKFSEDIAGEDDNEGDNEFPFSFDDSPF